MLLNIEWQTELGLLGNSINQGQVWIQKDILEQLKSESSDSAAKRVMLLKIYFHLTTKREPSAQGRSQEAFQQYRLQLLHRSFHFMLASAANLQNRLIRKLASGRLERRSHLLLLRVRGRTSLTSRTSLCSAACAYVCVFVCAWLIAKSIRERFRNRQEQNEAHSTKYRRWLSYWNWLIF